MVSFPDILLRVVYPLFALLMYAWAELSIFMNIYLIALVLSGLMFFLVILLHEAEVPEITESVERIVQDSKELDSQVSMDRVVLIIFEVLFAAAAFIVGFPWITGLLIAVAFLKRLMLSLG